MADNLETWVKANGKWLAIGAAALVVLMMVSQENQQAGPQDGSAPFDQGGGQGGDSSMPYDSTSPYGPGGDDTGFDMDKWRDEQAADDAQQQERIDRIREVDRCTDPDTGEVHEVPSGIGCPT